MVEPMVFIDRLDIHCEKKGGVEADCQTFDLSNLKTDYHLLRW